ncbi:TetR/AcrR family transcriptional regulator [Streptomyces katsurahamanus]|uniref:TetR family transcriptional regulator n=1 Tax=Streptomyces katsurahamanus TaxID=2577098 RepID=A0ABW9NT39_9ACTN|nr:TetR family transcriptional regulator [Streptomyces katsurahamanus]MQS36329.1 TetR family transcriptional regulator [Streptomyces katsurahamanus]
MAALAHTPSRAPSPTGLAGPEPRQGTMGLRERKKLKTRRAIRRAAYRLIALQGYETTTVEQIAEAAEVSPSTVFRYFPAKEDIVLTDDYDPALESALRARPAGEDPLDSVRRVLTHRLALALHEERDAVVQRTRLMAEVPALRARMTESFSGAFETLAVTLADRAGRPHDDLDVRVFTATVLAAVREVLLYWAARGHEGDPVALVDRALRALKGGPRI